MGVGRLALGGSQDDHDTSGEVSCCVNGLNGDRAAVRHGEGRGLWLICKDVRENLCWNVYLEA